MMSDYEELRKAIWDAAAGDHDPDMFDEAVDALLAHAEAEAREKERERCTQELAMLRAQNEELVKAVSAFRANEPPVPVIIRDRGEES